MNALSLTGFLTLLAGFSFRQTLFVVFLIAVLAVIFLSRKGREILWAPTVPASDGSVPAMRHYRLIVVYALAAIVIGGSLITWARDTEYWPYSPYPMFSWLSPRKDFKFTTLRLYGVTQEQPLAEFPIEWNQELEPFDDSRMPQGLGIALQQGRLQPALKDCLDRYEALRVEGIHKGPPLVGIRLYRVTWYMDDQASNVDTPSSRELLGQLAGRESAARGQ